MPLPDSNDRKRQRLPGFDYAQPGCYFITISVNRRACLLGAIHEGTLRASAIGAVVERCWHELPSRFHAISVDVFTLMPNHVHGVIEVRGSSGAALPEIVRVFKSVSANQTRPLRTAAKLPLWQRGYYEHIVRNEADFDRIRQYIADNPMNWDLDEDNPARPRRATE